MPRDLSECHEGVTRKGEFQPCEKPAVAMRLDPTEGTPYPVCAYHARADMVLLTEVLADERERIAREIEAERPEMGSHVNVTPYRQGKDDGLTLARDIARGQA